jgi:tripeptidyl-peptidase-1
MGFLNPWLYGSAAGKALNDITLGGSLGCSGIDLQNGIKNPKFGHIPYASWNATIGWDPVTGESSDGHTSLKSLLTLPTIGLGTPNFQEMKALALSG